MTKIIGILAVMLWSIAAYSQTTKVEFGYDNDGNMTSRKVAVIPRSILRTIVQHHDSIVDVISEQKVVFYPNPTKGVFRIHITPLDGKVSNHFELYALSGTLLITRDIVGELTEVNITDYTTATYLLNVHLGGKVSRWKVIKE
ncbi:MAG: T9SS type A sorting domain-containing protein [Bacteroidota bacterium]